MVGTQVERNIYIASLQTFALAQRELAERVIGREKANSLRTEIAHDPIFNEAFKRTRREVPFQDSVPVLSDKEVFIGGKLIQNLIASNKVRVTDLSCLADTVLKDPDFLMDVIDISKEQQIEDKGGWSKVANLNEKFIDRMLGSLHLAELNRDYDEAIRREGPLSLAAHVIGAELAVIGWLPLEFVVPKGRIS